MIDSQSITIYKKELVGTLLAMCYMAGAIAVHFVGNEPLGLQVGIETLIWVVAFFRFPELSQRLCSCNNSCKK